MTTSPNSSSSDRLMLGSVELDLWPRSGLQYLFSSDAPSGVFCFLDLWLVAAIVAGWALAGPSLDPDVGIAEVLTQTAWTFTAAVLLYGAGVGAAAGAAAWWLSGNRLILREGALELKTSEEELTLPFEEIVLVWVCNHPTCRYAATCQDQTLTLSPPPDGEAGPARVLSNLITWNFGLVSGLLVLMRASFGEAKSVDWPSRWPPLKVFIVVRLLHRLQERLPTRFDHHPLWPIHPTRAPVKK